MDASAAKTHFDGDARGDNTHPPAPGLAANPRRDTHSINGRDASWRAPLANEAGWHCKLFPGPAWWLPHSRRDAHTAPGTSRAGARRSKGHLQHRQGWGASPHGWSQQHTRAGLSRPGCVTQWHTCQRTFILSSSLKNAFPRRFAATQQLYWLVSRRSDLALRLASHASAPWAFLCQFAPRASQPVQTTASREGGCALLTPFGPPHPTHPPTSDPRSHLRAEQLLRLAQDLGALQSRCRAKVGVQGWNKGQTVRNPVPVLALHVCSAGSWPSTEPGARSDLAAASSGHSPTCGSLCPQRETHFLCKYLQNFSWGYFVGQNRYNPKIGAA